MEILGEDATDPQWGVEKCMRDAKLGQIFEGTNQINRLHVAEDVLDYVARVWRRPVSLQTVGASGNPRVLSSAPGSRSTREA